MNEDLYIVRMYDYYDGWIDVTGPMSREKADAEWREKTGNGTHHFQFSRNDHYYNVFPANTRMIYTPEFLGR